MRRAATPVLAAALLAAGPAPAGEWLARDLGQTHTEADCVEVSIRAFETFARLFGGGAIRVSGWVVTLDDLARKGDDAAITCTWGVGGRARGTLLIHSPADAFSRRFAADQIAGYWRSFAAEADAARRKGLGLERWE